MTGPAVHVVFGGRKTTVAGTGRPYTVVWDGTCNPCRHLVRLLEKWDTRGEIETLPSQNTTVLSRFPWIPPEAYTEALQLIGPGGATWQGADAVERLLRTLPHGGWLGWIFHIPLVDTFFDRFYRWFARNRYHFGCGEHCQARPLEVEDGERT